MPIPNRQALVRAVAQTVKTPFGGPIISPERTSDGALNVLVLPHPALGRFVRLYLVAVQPAEGRYLLFGEEENSPSAVMRCMRPLPGPEDAGCEWQRVCFAQQSIDPKAPLYMLFGSHDIGASVGTPLHFLDFKWVPKYRSSQLQSQWKDFDPVGQDHLGTSATPPVVDVTGPGGPISFGSDVATPGPSLSSPPAFADDPVISDTEKVASGIYDLLAHAPNPVLDRAILHIPDDFSSSEAKERPSSLQFVIASCRYPGGLLDRTPASASIHDRKDALTPPFGPADASLSRLLTRLVPDVAAGCDRIPQLALFMGDQVYLDATAGLFDPVAFAKPFRRNYENMFSTPVAHAVFARAKRVETILDDHEVSDNWEPYLRARFARRSLNHAVGQFLNWQRFEAGPQRPKVPSQQPCKHPSLLPLMAPAHLDKSFDLGLTAFFLADTRTERTPRDARNWQHAEIMTPGQMCRLLDWLNTKRDKTFKFIACPSMLLPRRLAVIDVPESAVCADAWDGYPRSRDTLLAAIAEEGHEGVVFLSGDEHIPMLTKISMNRTATGEESKEGVTIWSIHSSALYAPFPFANSRPADFRMVDRFDVGSWEVHAVSVSPSVGDHFAVLTLEGERTLEVAFDGNRGKEKYLIDLQNNSMERIERGECN